MGLGDWFDVIEQSGKQTRSLHDEIREKLGEPDEIETLEDDMGQIGYWRAPWGVISLHRASPDRPWSIPSRVDYTDACIKLLAGMLERPPRG